MNYGYVSKILRVNLSDQKITFEQPSERFYRYHFGGRGLIVYYLLRELESHIDPLGPHNKLIFASGPLTGAPFSGSGRNSVGGKSPLTGSYGEAEVGGFWGAELKHAGFDAIIVEGKAADPVYLWICDGDVEIIDASSLWGKEIRQSQEAIRKSLGDNSVKIAQIGPGGEKLVRYASVVNDMNHVAGRCGLGAVMGSKNFKAIAVRGTGKVNVADPENLQKLAQWMARSVKVVAGELHIYGTGSVMDVYEHTGNLPVNNFREGNFPGVESISARALKERLEVRMGTCYACAVACKKKVHVGAPWNVDPVYGGPEYESLAALGSNCGVDDLGPYAKLTSYAKDILWIRLAPVWLWALLWSALKKV